MLNQPPQPDVEGFQSHVDFCSCYRPPAPAEVWTLALWGEQLRWHLPAHCTSTNGHTNSPLWPLIHHNHNFADLSGMSALAIGTAEWRHCFYHLAPQHNKYAIFQYLLFLAPLFLLQVSYVSVSTREIYSKVGRELLASIAAVHPYIISVLLERLRETLKTIGMVGFINPFRLNLHFEKVIVRKHFSCIFHCHC